MAHILVPNSLHIPFTNCSFNHIPLAPIVQYVSKGNQEAMQGLLKGNWGDVGHLDPLSVPCNLGALKLNRTRHAHSEGYKSRIWGVQTVPDRTSRF